MQTRFRDVKYKILTLTTKTCRGKLTSQVNKQQVKKWSIQVVKIFYHKTSKDRMKG